RRLGADLPPRVPVLGCVLPDARDRVSRRRRGPPGGDPAVRARVRARGRDGDDRVARDPERARGLDLDAGGEVLREPLPTEGPPRGRRRDERPGPLRDRRLGRVRAARLPLLPLDDARADDAGLRAAARDEPPARDPREPDAEHRLGARRRPQRGLRDDGRADGPARPQLHAADPDLRVRRGRARRHRQPRRFGRRGVRDRNRDQPAERVRPVHRDRAAAAGRARRPPRRPLRTRRRETGLTPRLASVAVRAAAVAAVAALVVLLPHAFDDFLNYRFAFVGIYFIAIIGLNVLTGYNGQISLGHGAFLAFGAYTTAILSTNYGVGEYWTIPIAGDVTGIFGLAFGLPALRLSGVYLALATFGLAVSIVLVAKRFEGFTGGGGGKTLTLPSSPFGALSTNEWLSYLTWGVAGLMFVAAWLLTRGRLGRSL